MAESWRKGTFQRAEHFLDLHPELWTVPAAVLDLLYEELCLCQEYGQPADAEELVLRFPNWEAQIKILLNCVQALEAQPVPALPEAGDTVGDFRLLARLGQGGQGQVFLACQLSLGDRPVVLKISTQRGGEHLSLAQLQHTHIVPLLSVLDDAEANLRVLCMPYFGGLSLAAILVRLQDQAPGQRTGQQVIELLDAERSAAVVRLIPGRDPVTPFFQRASYVQAITWIGACLAEALKYAHERGLIHLDLKPSNVLLTADRQPMLLDFHLARAPLGAGDQAEQFGGTPAYMPPEQKAALTAIRDGRPVPESIDGRADIYSLGLTLYEALAGRLPDTPQTGMSVPPLAPVSFYNSQVSPGLSDLMVKCLAPRPCDRYQDAGSLAADLWAHLNDLPLRGVANRSWTERWRKWRRRSPHLLSVWASSAAVVVATAAVVVIGGTFYRHRLNEASVALAEGRQLLSDGHLAEAMKAFHRGQSQLTPLPDNRDLKRDLGSGLEQAIRTQAARELHDIADRFRSLYGVDFLPSDRLRALEQRAREFWQNRNDILARVEEKLHPELEQQARIDLLDLAILGADLHVGLATPNGTALARREALATLAEAEAFAGASAVLYQERQAHAQALGLTDMASDVQNRAAAFPPRTAWEHYALGRAYLRSGQLQAARSHLEQAVVLRPDDLWANFYQGICCYRLRDFQGAAQAFTACVTLAPKNAGCSYNRGLAFAGMGRTKEALADFDRALKLEPRLAEAAFNRGLVHLRENEPLRAAADFRMALDNGIDPARGHVHLAHAFLAQNDRKTALSHVQQALQTDPRHAEARQLLKRLEQRP
jgi:serine/threonine protein kinase/tetratricopeptide (TPR) repeat protein